MDNQIAINDKLIVGMIIFGSLSHYDEDELLKCKDIQYIASILRKKHFNIKNGTVKERMGNNIQIINKKREIWTFYADISNSIWLEASKRLKTGEIAIISLILSLLRKRPDVVKWYGFNEKRLKKIHLESLKTRNYMMASSIASSKLLEVMDEKIDEYNKKYIKAI